MNEGIYSALIVPFSIAVIVIGFFVLGRRLWLWYTGMKEVHDRLRLLAQMIARLSYIQIRLARSGPGDPAILELERKAADLMKEV